MNAASVVTLDAPTLAALRARMCAAGNNLSISNIASQAIRAWLADHPVPVQKYERRGDHHRRAADAMADHAMFD